MKVMDKYFLALLPPKEILDRVHQIKQKLQEEYGIKYALKSPPHITLKMPFSYNEAKEDRLVGRLREFAACKEPFPLRITGVGTFGSRVIFLGVERSETLLQLQHDLIVFCKRELHLVDELSDRNFHPHMTVAFKDLKKPNFAKALAFVNERKFDADFLVSSFTLLKRADGRWGAKKEVGFRE